MEFSLDDLLKGAEEDHMPAPELKIFFILDTSGSMKEFRGYSAISSLNRLMQTLIDELRTIDSANDEFDIKVAIMEYNDEAKWLTPYGPENVHDYQHVDLTAGGKTYLGKALELLDNVLSSDGWMSRDNTSNIMPIFVFISDGLPMGDWKEKLEKLNSNVWFRRNPHSNSVKLGFLLTPEGLDVPQARTAMETLVGDSSKVLTFDDLKTFEENVRPIVVGTTILHAQGTHLIGRLPDNATNDNSQPDPLDLLNAAFGSNGINNPSV